MPRVEGGIPRGVLEELLEEVKRLREENGLLSQRVRELERGRGSSPVDYLGGEAEREGDIRPSLITPAMEATLKAVSELQGSGTSIDADAVASATGRSKTRESQYLSFLARLGKLRQDRRGHRILYRKV